MQPATAPMAMPAFAPTESLFSSLLEDVGWFVVLVGVALEVGAFNEAMDDSEVGDNEYVDDN
jgi:hypothetical protein